MVACGVDTVSDCLSVRCPNTPRNLPVMSRNTDFTALAPPLSSSTLRSRTMNALLPTAAIR